MLACPLAGHHTEAISELWLRLGMYPYGLGNFGDFSHGGFEAEVCEAGVSGNLRLISARNLKDG